MYCVPPENLALKSQNTNREYCHTLLAVKQLKSLLMTHHPINTQYSTENHQHQNLEYKCYWFDVLPDSIFFLNSDLFFVELRGQKVTAEEKKK